ncbi:unnamed protein product [Arctogadus glacialis]
MEFEGALSIECLLSDIPSLVVGEKWQSRVCGGVCHQDTSSESGRYSDAPVVTICHQLGQTHYLQQFVESFSPPGSSVTTVR